MDWVMVNAIATATYTLAFVFGVMLTNIHAGFHLRELEKNRELQILMAIFRELKTRDFIAERKYVYEKFPENIEGVDENQLKTHLQKVETALTALSRIGYLLEKGYIDEEPILENYWALVWRCWKKSKDLISWVREKREEKDYFGKFEYLFQLAESYRIEHGYPKPKFY